MFTFLFFYDIIFFVLYLKKNVLVLKGGFSIMFANVKKIGNKLSIEIPLDQSELKPENIFSLSSV